MSEGMPARVLSTAEKRLFFHTAIVFFTLGMVAGMVLAIVNGVGGHG